MILASSARCCITPQKDLFPCYLLGHAIRTKKAVGVADDLWVNTLVLKENEKTWIWCVVDLGGLERTVSDSIRNKLAQRYQTSMESINLGFIHTHAAPEYADVSPFSNTDRAAVKGTMEFIEQQIYASVQLAFEQPFLPVTARMKQTTIDGFYSNRNGKDKIADKTLTLVELSHQDRVIGLLCNFACHPTVLGPQNLYISADLAGYLSVSLQHRFGCAAMILQGAAGDMSNRLYRQGNDYPELIRTGEGIMKQVDDNKEWINLNLQDCQVDTFHFHQEFHVDPLAKQQKVLDIEKKLSEVSTFDEKKVYTSALAIAKAFVNQTESCLDFDCHYYRMDELHVLTMPAELFSRFGLQLKVQMKTTCPLFWGYSNYSVGYLFNKEEAGQSFESVASDMPAGTTEIIIAQLIDWMNSLQ